MTELTDMELDRVTGGQGIPSGATPPPTGNLGSDVVRFFTDAAHSASKATLLKALRAIEGATIPLPNPASGYNLLQNLFG